MLWKSAVILFVVAVLIASGCYVLSKPPAKETSPDTPKGKETEFATGGGGKAVAFDAKRAMGYLKAICDIGPRISGTEGMKKQQELIQKHFEDLGAKVDVSALHGQAAQPARTGVEMANMIVSWHPERERRVILCSHYDTRPIADQEDDRAQLAQALRQRQRRRLRRRPADGAGPPHEGPENQRRRRFRLLRRRGVHLRRHDATDYFFGSEHFGDGIYARASAASRSTRRHPARHDRRQGRRASRSEQNSLYPRPGSWSRASGASPSELKVKAFEEDMGPASRTITWP